MIILPNYSEVVARGCSGSCIRLAWEICHMQAPRLCPQGRGDPEGCIFTKFHRWLQCLLQFEDHHVTDSEWTVSVHPQGGSIQLHQ